MAAAAGDAKTKAISSGTAGGMAEFFGYLVEKGYANNSQVRPWASASAQVFQQMEGDDWRDLDVRQLDLQDYMDRFENRTRGDYKQESVVAYRRRVARGIHAYVEYLVSGKTPSFKARQPRTKRDAGTVTAKSEQTGHGEVVTPVLPPPAQQQLMDIPFPLESGDLAYLRLPRRLSRGDAERMAALIKTFVIEGQRQLPAGHDESGADGGD
jgi:hypothetical protein